MWHKSERVHNAGTTPYILGCPVGGEVAPGVGTKVGTSFRVVLGFIVRAFLVDVDDVGVSVSERWVWFACWCSAGNRGWC